MDQRELSGDALIAFALVVAASLLAMSIYAKLRPPDASPWRTLSQARHSPWRSMFGGDSVVIRGHAVRTARTSFASLGACAFVGNILNLVSLVFCLRATNGQSLFAGVLVLFNQLLWIMYALRALTVEF